MHNFPTHFWRKFQTFKEHVAIRDVGDAHKVVEQTYWEWTRRIQRLAIALLEAGFEPGARLALVGADGHDWLDLGFASWLVGGCVVLVPADASRPKTLRALGRTGSQWIAVDDADTYQWLRGEAGGLPPDLRWICVADSPDWPGDPGFFKLDQLDQRGRSLAVRGWVDKLAAAIYDVSPDQASLILFDAPLGDDPHGAYFSGRNVGDMLDMLGQDLQLGDDDCVLSVADYGQYPAWLISAATLLQGKRLAGAAADTAAADHLDILEPTRVICGSDFLSRRAGRLREDMESSVDDLQADGAQQRSGLGALLSRASKEAARRLFFDPLSRQFGGKLSCIYLLDDHLGDDVTDVIDRTELCLLGVFGLAEAGVTHIERPGARRRGSVGRPVQGYSCKIEGAKRGQVGPILIRGQTLFDGYWDDRGPRHIDADGWLHTGRRGRIESGYLFVE